ncbi:hypothetical protein H920_16283 [Fukomys damarensis]|uniref:Secreted protein n=1 Tax=Fukomys damarensis TaxID=885580 RepID=A0A091CUZ1_FUKDA|nr:hypothetical protein H920_16283 [Fukomys damarensis]
MPVFFVVVVVIVAVVISCITSQRHVTPYIPGSGKIPTKAYPRSYWKMEKAYRPRSSVLEVRSGGNQETCWF